MDYNDIIDGSIAALQDEIDEIKRKGVGKNISVLNGEFGGERGRRFFYRFELEDELLAIPDDSPIEFRIDNKIINGNIVGRDKQYLLIALEEFVGQVVVRAVLVSKPYYLMESLKNVLEAVKSDKIVFADHTCKKVFGLEKSKTDKDFRFSIDTTCEPKPNEFQEKAIALSKGSDTAFIWGPPGTGKTETLARITEVFFKDDKRILITSHTNAAVDKALLDVLNILRNEPEYEDGRIVRYGMILNEELRSGYEKFVSVEQIAERKNKQWKNDLEIALKEKEKLEIEIEGISESLRKAQAIARLGGKIRDIEQNLVEMNSQKLRVEESIKEHSKTITEIDAKITQAKSMGNIRRFLHGLSIDKLLKEKDYHSTKLEADEGALAKQKNRIHEKQTKGDNLKIELERLKKSLGGDIIDEHILEKRKEEVSKKLTEINNFIEYINKILSEAEKNILNEAKIIAATITKTHTSPELQSIRYDAVIIDECSMVPIPMVFWVSGLAKEKVVILGDFKQLSPIAISESENSKSWLKKSIFDYYGGNEQQLKSDDRLEALRKQYRMDRKISEILNSFVYTGENNLIDEIKYGDERLKILKLPPAPDQSIVIYDTSKIDPWCSRDPQSNSRMNLYSAILAVKLAELAIGSGIEDIGIVAPYSAQARLILRLRDDRGLKDKLRVSTIHKFQGDEKDLIIFDTTDSTGLKPGILLDNRMEGGDDDRLINVAISRTKSKFILIANLSYVKSRHSPTSLLKKVIEHIEIKGQVIPSDEILESYGVADFDSVISVDRENYDPSGVTIHTQKEFYNYFFADLKDAKKELVVFSPFIYKGRTSKLIDILRSHIERGLEMTLFTMPSDNLDTKELIDYLKKIGIRVFQKHKMHEKFAVIDERITWSGSLNIFSQSNTTEQMIRVDAPKFAEEILSRFQVNKYIEGTLLDAKAKKEKLKMKIDLQNRITEILKEHCLKSGCGGKMLVKEGKYGMFLSCARCLSTRNLKENHINRLPPVKCDKCGAPMVPKWGVKSKSLFLGCSLYPECKNIKNISLSLWEKLIA